MFCATSSDVEALEWIVIAHPLDDVDAWLAGTVADARELLKLSPFVEMFNGEPSYIDFSACKQQRRESFSIQLISFRWESVTLGR